MERRYYSNKHFERINNGRKDNPSDVEFRKVFAKVKEILDKERSILYPIVTLENAKQMIEWQEKRIKELLILEGKENG